MRLDAHANIPVGHHGAAGAPRGPLTLSPFFAGMTPAARSALVDALAEIGGLILVAGPAGSARGSTLRGLLRSRPDALAVGEIDSHEAAASALRAARGGLVVGTVSSGDTLGALGRLADLGIDRFPLACVLRLVLAQRQVRRLCPTCRSPWQASHKLAAPLGLEPGAIVYSGRGCHGCEESGFAGPIGVFETLPVDATVGRLIACGADESAIANHAFRKWPNLAAAARALVARGLTTPDEAIGVTRPQRQ